MKNTFPTLFFCQFSFRRDAPKTYQDLLDPRWKGKICIVDKLYEWYLGMQRYMKEDAADRYLKRLSEQNVILRGERTLVAQLLAAGEHSIAVGVYAHEFEKLKADRASGPFSNSIF